MKTPKLIDLAIATGYDKSHISRVVRAKARPSLKCAELLSKEMDISIEQLTMILRFVESYVR